MTVLGLFWGSLLCFNFTPLIVYGRSVPTDQDSKDLSTLFHSENDDTSHIKKVSGGSCILDVNRDLPKKNEPLLLSPAGKNHYSLLLPEAEGKRGVIALREGEQVLIACPGNKNYLEATKDSLSTAVCSAGTTLSLNGRQFTADQLDCSGRVQAKTVITQRTCANGKGVVVELGFEAAGWTKVVETCHNLAQSHTYYAVHTINGDKLAGKVYRKNGRPSFARGDKNLFKGFNPDKSYTQENQRRVLSSSLGAQNAAQLGEQKSAFLARGHLAPDADFILSPHQLLTYFYVNVAPQWQSINAGNWLRIEEASRKTATQLGADIQVVTGTYGVLQLPGQGGQKQITLEDGRVPVPELFYKVLRNTQDDSCIAFVASNNPFTKQPPKQICPDVCAQNGWPVYQNDFVKGYIYCCDYQQIKKAVPEMPNLTCKSTLRG